MQPNRVWITFGIVAAPVCLAVYLLTTFWTQKRDVRDRTTCQGNLRRIGQALQMYIADNDDYLPTPEMWYQQTIPGVPLTGCPSAERVPALDPPLGGVGHGPPGYAFNANLVGKAGYVNGRYMSLPLANAELAHPETTLIVLDQTSGITTVGALNPYGRNERDWPKVLVKGWKRHNGGGNYLFCDGHVGWFVESQILFTEPDMCYGDKTHPNFCAK